MRERPRLQFDVPLQVGGLQIPWLEVQDSRCAEGAIVAATYADEIYTLSLHDALPISMIATTRSTSFLRYWKRPSSAVRCRSMSTSTRFGGIRSAFISARIGASLARSRESRRRVGY